MSELSSWVPPLQPTYRTSSRRVPVGAVLVVRDRTIRPDDSDWWYLVIKRKGSRGEGTWSFPGGWVDPGEDPARAAIRETWEEVGLSVERASWLGYTTDKHPEDSLDVVTMWFLGHGFFSMRARNTNPDRIETVDWWPEQRLRAAQRTSLFVPLRNALDCDDLFGLLR